MDVVDCRFSSNGRWLVWKATDAKKTVLVGQSDLQTGTAVALNTNALPGDVSSAGDRFLTADGIHDVEHGDLLLSAPCLSGLWSPDGLRIATVDAQGSLRLLSAPPNAASLPDKPDGPAPPDAADLAVDTPPVPPEQALPSRKRAAKDVSPNASSSPIAPVETVPAVNLLKPTNRAESWRLDIFEGAKAAIAAVDDSIVFNVDAVTGTDWHVQAFQTDLHLTDGDQYNIRFSAKASEPRKVVLGAHIDEADWHSIGLSTPIPLTTAFQTFQVPFRVQNAGEKKCRIGFVLGASTGVVTIKNITLTESTAAKTSSLDRPSTLDQSTTPTATANNPRATPEPTAKTKGVDRPAIDVQTARKRQEQAATERNVPVEGTNSIGIKLRLIPAGSFTMGSPATEKDRAEIEAQVDVTLTRPFYLATTEVTQRQWETVMGTAPWKGKLGYGIGPDFPAVLISWDDATAFCQKLSSLEGLKTTPYRLPTDAEWELACRAGTTTAYWFGNDAARLVDYAWCYVNTHAVGESYVHPVARKPANPFGLFDMHGNVWEWCADIHSAKAIGGVDPVVPGESPNRAIRGGGCSFDKHCRSAFRGGRPRNDLAVDLGFRVAR
jgi:formylglycine-generating enzyme required for sulfatase activity